MQLKISDMMNDLLPEEDLLPPTAKTPDYDLSRVKSLVRSHLAQNEPTSLPRRHRAARSTRWLTAAAAILLFTGTAFAAVHFQWDEALRGYLQPTDKQLEELTPAGVNIDQTITSDGTTVTVRQVLGDKYGVYILLDITAPEGVVLDDTCRFEKNYLRFTSPTDEPMSMGYGMTVLTNDDAPANTISALFDLNASSSLVGTTAHLKLENLQHYILGPDGDFETIAEGTWEFEWPMNYTDLSQTTNINQPLALLDDRDTLTSVTLSPLSLTLTVQGPGAQQASDDPETDLSSFNETDAIYLLTTNSKIPLPWQTIGTSANGDTLLITYTFGKILDTAAITGLELNGQRIPF